MRYQKILSVLILLLVTVLAACAKKPPVATAPPSVPPMPTAFPSAGGPLPPGPAPATGEAPRIGSETAITSSPLTAWESQPIDVINGPDSPLKPAYFDYDSDEIDSDAQRALDANAALLRQYRTWVVTIEGHCDERGTTEYNLALGDRRALAAKTYLVSLGISPDRIRTVSYGNEFPFDPAHNESAWAKNRRAHFMLTSK